jgi:hypothetical protein
LIEIPRRQYPQTWWLLDVVNRDVRLLGEEIVDLSPGAIELRHVARELRGWAEASERWQAPPGLKVSLRNYSQLIPARTVLASLSRVSVLDRAIAKILATSRGLPGTYPRLACCIPSSSRQTAN